MKIAFDCRHYRGDRPCQPHKHRQRVCDNCPEFDPIRNNLLVIKLGAVGDVVRTTPIVESLATRRPHSLIGWLTRSPALPVLEEIPHLDQAYQINAENLALLQAQHFTAVYCLDNDPVAAGIASQLNTRQMFGYCLDEMGRVRPVDTNAQGWLELALNDDAKRANARPWRAFLKDIAHLPQLGPIKLHLRQEEQQWAADFAREHDLPAEQIVGFNTGAGARWPTKCWPAEHFVQLARLLKPAHRTPVLLLGGPAEERLNRQLAHDHPDLFINGGVHPLRQFMAQVALCQAIVTADTLALHLAVGLGVAVVAMFGPTSAAEIDVQNRGVKLTPPSGCDCWYNARCTRERPCLADIEPETVFHALANWL